MPDFSNMMDADILDTRSGYLLPPLPQGPFAADADEPTILALEPLINFQITLKMLWPLCCLDVIVIKQKRCYIFETATRTRFSFLTQTPFEFLDKSRKENTIIQLGTMIRNRMEIFLELRKFINHFCSLCTQTAIRPQFIPYRNDSSCTYRTERPKNILRRRCGKFFIATRNAL